MILIKSETGVGDDDQICIVWLIRIPRYRVVTYFPALYSQVVRNSPAKVQWLFKVLHLIAFWELCKRGVVVADLWFEPVDVVPTVRPKGERWGLDFLYEVSQEASSTRDLILADFFLALLPLRASGPTWLTFVLLRYH